MSRISSTLLSILNNLLKKLQASDPDFNVSLDKYKNKSMLLKINPNIKINVMITDNAELELFSIDTSYDNEYIYDATIEGKLSEYIKSIYGVHYSKLNFKIDGEIDLIEHIQELSRSFSPEVKLLLSDHLGNSSANIAHTMINKFTKHKKEFFENRTKDIIEFLQEELRVIPTKHQVELFADDVFELKLAVDRLEARYSKVVT